MGSTTIQARSGEDNCPIGRFILDRARTLGMSRSEPVHRLGYREIGNGHRVLAELLTTGTMPQRIARHLADALQVDEAHHRHRHLGDRATAARRSGSTYSSRETA